MKTQLKKNLEARFAACYQTFAHLSAVDFFNDLIDNNPEVYFQHSASPENLYDEDQLELLEEAKEHPKLKKRFKRIKKTLESDHPELITKLGADILSSLATIKTTIAERAIDDKNQIIFLEYDYEPYCYWCGFGEGEYPILKTPQYLKVDSNELYNGVGRVDFSPLWKDLIAFEELLEELEIEDEVLDSDQYEKIKEAFQHKLFLLLHQAFDRLPLTAFEGIPIQLPLFIYGNEHDCEVMNIYMYE